MRKLLQDLADGKLAAKGQPTKVASRNLRAVLSKTFDWAADQGFLAGTGRSGSWRALQGGARPHDGQDDRGRGRPEGQAGPWTPHDLRRTAASKMRTMGTSHRVVQAILKHKDRSVTAVYDRYAMGQEKTEALATWGRRVEEITGGATPAAVVAFPSPPSRAVAGEGRAVWRRGQGSE